LNEVEVNTPNQISEPCEFAEVLGTAGTLAPAGTFFLSIDGDPGSFGQVNYIADLSGVPFGPNGTITIITNSDVCAGRIYPPGTTVVFSNSFAMGFGAETLILVHSTNPGQLFEGQDLDADDNGVLDAFFGLTAIDGVGWTGDPSSTAAVVYGGVPNLGGPPLPLADVPDAASRFVGNTTPLSRPAWYYGHVSSAGGDASTTYAAPGSFPAGAMLTPGSTNSH
jgi:hypothetical protein